MFPSEVNAQVVINEFSSSDSSDWIEIFNTSSSEVPLSGWIIKDTASTSIYEFIGERIPSGTFCFQPASNRLNNGGDKIQLFNGSTQIDCVSYGDGNGSFCGSQADVVSPSSGQTASRVPDGTGSWVLGASTKSSISCESLVPTPTPSPTPTPTTASTPTPTPTPTKTPTPVPTKKPTPQPSLKASAGTVNPTSISTDILGASDDSSPTPEPKEAQDSSKLPILAIIFILLGVISIGGASYSIWYKSKNPEPQNTI